MKAITIWQPWASLLACGGKRFETRSWATSYRGPIAIHASKKNVFSALRLIPIPISNVMKMTLRSEWEELPTGAVIATANLIGCHEIGRINAIEASFFAEIPYVTSPQKTGCWDCNRPGTWIDATKQEEIFGDWTPGRYAWEFSNMKMMTPIPVSGRQGLWEWKGVPG